MTISSAVIIASVKKEYDNGKNSAEIAAKLYSEAKRNGADCTELEIRKSVEDALLMLNRKPVGVK